MLVAQFHFGPFDGKRLILPTEEPWPRFVIPKFGDLLVEHFYLYAGWERDLALYLYDGDYGILINDETSR